MSSRIEQLRKLVQAQPDDPFSHYGLGLEYMKLEQFDEALAAFDHAIALDANYVAAYLQKAQAELKLNRREQAGETLRSGMTAARNAGDNHSADEMQKILETLS